MYMARGVDHESVQVGTVVQSKGNLVTVQLQDGEQEDVRLPVLAACASGQLFKAVVTREVGTFKLRSLTCCELLTSDLK